jgi:hypothetical protein
VSRLTLGLLVLAAGVVAGYLWWNSEERQIRRVLAAVEDGFTFQGSASGLGTLSAAAGVQPYFAPEVVIEPGRPFPSLEGLDAVLAATARLRSSVPSLRVEFVDVQIDLAEDSRSADVNCTAIATVRDRAGQESVDAREVLITMRVVDGRWVIAHARALEVLEPITP